MLTVLCELWGLDLIAATINLKPSSSLFGEGYSVIMAGSSNPAFSKNVSSGGQPTPMLATPQGAAGVRLVDLTIMADGDVPGCVLIDWQCGEGSGAWDVMFRIEHAVWAQMRLHGAAAGYFESASHRHPTPCLQPRARHCA